MMHTYEINLMWVYTSKLAQIRAVEAVVFEGKAEDELQYYVDGCIEIGNSTIKQTRSQ